MMRRDYGRLYHFWVQKWIDLCGRWVLGSCVAFGVLLLLILLLWKMRDGQMCLSWHPRAFWIQELFSCGFVEKLGPKIEFVGASRGFGGWGVA